MHPADVFARLDRAAAEALRQLRQQVIHRIGLVLQPFAQSLARERHTLGLGRLQQVIDCALLKRVDRELVVRGDEDHVRSARERLRGLDAVELGHPDVQEHDVGVETAHHRDRLAAVARLADDLQARAMRRSTR